jgi:cytochrome c heme-lyase
MPLGTHRERSSIPSGKGDELRWVYPSEQQFFNALLRKGWQPDERDVPAVVHIHNQVSSPP